MHCAKSGPYRDALVRSSRFGMSNVGKLLQHPVGILQELVNCKGVELENSR
jgi:hypothetical protein